MHSMVEGAGREGRRQRVSYAAILPAGKLALMAYERRLETRPSRSADKLICQKRAHDSTHQITEDRQPKTYWR